MSLFGSIRMDDTGYSIISPFKETHQWQQVICAECGVKGVALVNVTTKENRQHFCYLHNPAVQEACK